MKNHRKDTFAFCTRCEAKLAESKIVWLELDQRTGTYTDQSVPAEFSQGAFPFGKDCARNEVQEHNAVLDQNKRIDEEVSEYETRAAIQLGQSVMAGAVDADGYNHQ